MSSLSATIGATAAGEKSIIARARTYIPNYKPLILFMHGYNGDATFMQKNVNFTDWDLLVKAGFPCISTDMGGLATFGNDVSQAAIDNAINYATAALAPRAGAVHLHCGSMSTLAAFRYAKNNPAKVLSVVVETPAFDLQYMHDIAPGLTQGGESTSVTLPNLVPDIEASAGGAANLTQTYYTEHSPIVFANAASLPMPIKAFSSSNDVLANGPVTCPEMASLIGSTFQYHILGPEAGLGHAVLDLDSNEVVDFFHTHS